MKDWVYYALALIGLVGLPLMSTFVASMVHELRRGNDHGMPLRAWFAVGFASAAILILAVILLKLDAFFPELGDTFGVSACAFAGIVFSVLAPHRLAQVPEAGRLPTNRMAGKQHAAGSPPA